MSLAARALDVISPAVLVPLDRWVRGDKSAAYIGEVRRLTASPSDQIAEFQLARVREVVHHAARHTRFYAERLAEAGIDRPAALTWTEFKRLPLLTKDDIRHRERDLTSDAFSPSERIVRATGGTVSSPVRFYLDRESYWRRWSATLAFDAWLGYRPGRRIAYLWGARQDDPGPLSMKGRLRSALITRSRIYPSGLLDDSILDGYARDIARFRPVLLQAYPTPLTIFAEHLLRQRVHLDIPAISCTAEPLLADQREIIRSAFGRDPVNWYGARECGRIATECSRRDGLHLNVYGLYVEVLPVPDMTDAGIGEVVVTDLWNRALPLVRYRTGDLARFEGSICGCGLAAPRLRDVVGRIADTFVNSRGQRVPGVAFTNRLLTEDSRVQALQLLQHAPTRFEAIVVPGPDYDETTPAWLRARLATFMDDRIELIVRTVETIPREPSGKLRLAKNLMGDAG